MGFSRYLATVIITAIAGASVSAVLVFQTVHIIMRQIKLYHSINLVELKTNKYVYWIIAAIFGFLIFYVVMQMADPEAPCVTEFYALFGVGRTYTNIALMIVLIVLIAAESFIVTLGLSKNAVVDKGVYSNFGMLDWHHVRDYVIDEERCTLMLTSDKRTFSTLGGLTPPFKVKKGDIQKLKFILNKNKNKFSAFGND